MAIDAESVNWGRLQVDNDATADPAAGSDPATVTVPTGKKWRLLSVYGSMTTDANVIDRYIRLKITNGANIVSIFGNGEAHQASLQRPFTFAPGLPNALVATTTIGHLCAIPEGGIELPGGYTFQVQFDNIQAGDDCTAVRYQYKEMVEG